MRSLILDLCCNWFRKCANCQRYNFRCCHSVKWGSRLNSVALWFPTVAYLHTVRSAGHHAHTLQHNLCAGSMDSRPSKLICLKQSPAINEWHQAIPTTGLSSSQYPLEPFPKEGSNRAGAEPRRQSCRKQNQLPLQL